MTTFIEYELSEGGTILVELAQSDTGELIKVSQGAPEIAKVKAKKSFADALKEIKLQSSILLKEIEDLHVDEAEVKFGVTTVGELGNMAIGKIGAGVNYEITLKWKKPT